MRYFIPEIPPSLNKFAGRANSWEYRKTKAYWTELCNAYCRPRPKVPYSRARVTLEYHFPDIRRRDPDNYCGKMVLDGLTRSHIIKDDSFDCVELVLRQCEVDRAQPHVVIIVEEK